MSTKSIAQDMKFYKLNDQAARAYAQSPENRKALFDSLKRNGHYDTVCFDDKTVDVYVVRTPNRMDGKQLGFLLGRGMDIHHAETAPTAGKIARAATFTLALSAVPLAYAADAMIPGTGAASMFRDVALGSVGGYGASVAFEDSIQKLFSRPDVLPQIATEVEWK